MGRPLREGPIVGPRIGVRVGIAVGVSSGAAFRDPADGSSSVLASLSVSPSPAVMTR